jgi:hypothetical protein
MVLSFILKHDVWETGICIRVQVEPTQVGPIDPIWRQMENIQNYDSYINITSLQTYRQHWPVGLVAEL